MSSKVEGIFTSSFNDLEKTLWNIAAKGGISGDQNMVEIIDAVRNLRGACQPLLASDIAFSKTIEAERRAIAEELIESWSFPGDVEARSGWEVSGDEWTAKVFLSSEGQENSTSHEVRIEFVENRSEISEVSAPEAESKDLELEISM